MSPRYERPWNDQAYVTVQNVRCVLESKSGQAILCECDEWDEEKWIPTSQISDDSEVYKYNTEGDLIVTEWIAQQKGII